jgi:hypothetical protein
MRKYSMISYFHTIIIAIMFTPLPTLSHANPVVDEIVQEYEEWCIANHENKLGRSGVGDELSAVFTLKADAIYEIELAPDGTTGTVVSNEFHCEGFGYEWCGSNGCGFHIVVDGVAFERFGGARPFSVTVEDSTFVIIPLHHGSCSFSDGFRDATTSVACYDIATWDAQENTFIGQYNRIKVKQMNP